MRGEEEDKTDQSSVTTLVTTPLEEKEEKVDQTSMTSLEEEEEEIKSRKLAIIIMMNHWSENYMGSLNLASPSCSWININPLA
jgi:hypothetical protein